MIKGMMTSDFWSVISEVIRGGELLTRGRSESKLTRHKGQFLSSFANNPSPPPPLGPVQEIINPTEIGHGGCLHIQHLENTET